MLKRGFICVKWLGLCYVVRAMLLWWYYVVIILGVMLLLNCYNIPIIDGVLCGIL